MSSIALETLKGLCGLPRLEPALVADFLGRNPQVIEETEFQTLYSMNGGARYPFDSAELRWVRSKENGLLILNAAPGFDLPMEVVEREFAGAPSALIPPDHRDPHGETARVFRVPLGEIRFLYSGDPSHPGLRAVIVSEFPIVAW